jgi:phosphoserine phosphatase
MKPMRGMKKKPSETDSAEKKYEELLEKRNEVNDLAKAMRDARDLINQKKDATLDLVTSLKGEKDKYFRIRREHVELRNRFQAKAKELITKKKDRAKRIFADLPSEVNALRAELKYLEMQQQTQPMPIEEERKFTDDIRKKHADLQEKEKLLGEQSTLTTEVKELDGGIDDLFKKADEEHANVVELSSKIDELNKRIKGLIDELTSMHNESNKKHELHLKLRARADEYHLKAQEMRTKVIAMKREKNADEHEGRQVIKQSNAETRQFFSNKSTEEKIKDDALEKLKKGGKIELK